MAVLGAGVFGGWTAYLAARAGHRVIVLDAHGPANTRASSSGETRVLRMSYGAHSIYTRMSKKSLAEWQWFARSISEPLFLQTGVLMTAQRPSSYLEATRKTLTRAGVPHQWLSSTALRDRFPQMTFDRNTAGVFEPDSGVLVARRAIQAVLRQSTARYLEDAALSPTGQGKLAEIKTAGGQTVRAGVYVFACGAWLPDIFPDVLKGRIQTTKQELFFFGPPPGERRFSAPAMPAWVDFSEGAYAVPDIEGRGLKVGLDRHGPSFDPETGRRTVTHAKYEEARELLRQHFPAMQDAPLIASLVCLYENTSNGDFLIDRHPHFDNVWLVGGGSGHGFKHGPAVGEYVLAQIEGRGKPEPRFSLAAKGTQHQRSVF